MTDRTRRELEAIAAYDGASGWRELMWWADWQIEAGLEKKTMTRSRKPVPIPQRTCEICGATYEHRWRKTCSKPCESELRARRKRGLAPVVTAPCEVPQIAAKTRTVERDIACSQCGEPCRPKQGTVCAVCRGTARNESRYAPPIARAHSHEFRRQAIHWPND